MRRLSDATFKGARLDRALCTVDWKARFPNAFVKHLPRVKSDHSPLLIHFKGEEEGMKLKHFTFQAAWLTHPNFMNAVSNVWNPATNFEDNLATVEEVLKGWNRDVFGNIHKKKRELWARIGGIQRAMAKKFNRRLLKLDEKLKRELEDVLCQEELFLFQKVEKNGSGQVIAIRNIITPLQLQKRIEIVSQG